MRKEELSTKAAEIKIKWMEKEAKLEAYIQNWLAGNSTLSSEAIQQLNDSTTKQIEELKTTEQQLSQEYKRMVYEEELINTAKQTVKHQLNASPDELIITDGVLSTDASKTILIGERKSPEVLEQERLQLLNAIKTKILNKEITLAEASKLANDTNIAYGYTIPKFDDEDTPKR